jgi:nitrate reductase gamma subunit
MSKKVIIGSLSILSGFFLGYHAIGILTGWQSRNKQALGVTEFAPYFELLIGVVFAIIGLWLLFKRRTS